MPAVVEAFPGYFVTIPVTGTPPIYTAIIRNSTVLVNTTGTAAFRFYEESNCTCVASSNYGSDVNEFSVILKGQVIHYEYSVLKNIGVNMLNIFET